MMPTSHLQGPRTSEEWKELSNAFTIDYLGGVCHVDDSASLFQTFEMVRSAKVRVSSSPNTVRALEIDLTP